MKHAERIFALSFAFVIALFAGVPVAEAQDRPDSTHVVEMDLLERAREATIRARERSADALSQLNEAQSEREQRRRDILMMRIDGAGRDTLVINPEHATRLARRHMRDLQRNVRWFDFERMMGESSVVREMENEARELARRTRNAEGAERRQLETELQTLLETLMQEKLAHEEESLDRRRARLEEETQRLRERQERRTDIIERRFRDLIGERDVLEW